MMSLLVVELHLSEDATSFLEDETQLLVSDDLEKTQADFDSAKGGDSPMNYGFWSIDSVIVCFFGM